MLLLFENCLGLYITDATRAAVWDFELILLITLFHHYWCYNGFVLR